MRTVQTMFVFVALLLYVSPVLADIPVDISGSQCEIQSSDTVRMRHMTAPGSPDYAGQWWVDFQWNPAMLMFVPVNLGQEAIPTGHTWSWIVTNISRSFVYTLTSDPTQRAFHVSYQQHTGTPFICQDEDFFQGNNSFGLTDAPFLVNNSTALITYTTSFNGCGYLYAGQTIEGNITHLPSWFDFSQTFAVGFGASPMYCEPDGSHHQ